MTSLNCSWPYPPADLALVNNEVHIWRASLDQPAWRIQKLAQMLTEDEYKRAERFHFEQHRQRFIAGRGILRTILSCYLGIEPSLLQFCYGHRGKPALAAIDADKALRFNLSHSEGLAMYAIARDREIGIDLEYIRCVPDAEQIAARFFSCRENAVFRALPPEQKQAAFFNCWTRKEAYIKAIGDGLAFSLDQFDVSLSPGEPARLLGIKGSSAAAAHWSLQELTPAPGYVAALAVEGHGWSLICWQWPE